MKLRKKKESNPMQEKTKSMANYMAIRYEVKSRNEDNLEKAEKLAFKAMSWYEIAAGMKEENDE